MSTAASSVKPYQEVDGLQGIYVGAGATPTASFVFASKEQAQAAHESVAQAVKRAWIFGEGQQITNYNETTLLEILSASNLSEVSDKEERVLSFSAKMGGTVGAPMKSVHELLDRVGKTMKEGNPSKQINAVPIYFVDKPV